MMALPLLFVGIVARFPAGLAVYWITTSLWTLGQQIVMWRLQPDMAAQTLGGAMAMETGGTLEPADLERADAPPGATQRPPASRRRSASARRRGPRARGDVPRADRPLGAGRAHAAQPAGPGPAGRHRQLVRAPAGQALRRRLRGLRDGLQLRPQARQRAHAARVPAHPSRRAPGLDAAVRPRRRRHARGLRGGGRGRRRHRRPEHGLPGAQGVQDGRRRGAAGRSRQGGGHRQGGRRGQRPARDREAAPGPAPRRPRGRGAGPAPGRRGRRGRHRLPPPPRLPAAQGQARLRPGRRAGGGAGRAGDRLRRPALGREGAGWRWSAAAPRP